MVSERWLNQLVTERWNRPSSHGSIRGWRPSASDNQKMPRNATPNAATTTARWWKPKNATAPTGPSTQQTRCQRGRSHSSTRPSWWA